MSQFYSQPVKEYVEKNQTRVSQLGGFQFRQKLWPQGEKEYDGGGERFGIIRTVPQLKTVPFGSGGSAEEV